MKRKQHEELLETLELAEAQARDIVQTSGNCLPLLNRIRDCVRETRERVGAYKKAEAPAKQKAPKTKAKTPQENAEAVESGGAEGTAAN